jgi:hypothetical protein
MNWADRRTKPVILKPEVDRGIRCAGMPSAAWSLRATDVRVLRPLQRRYPRARFRGISSNLFDGRGNYTLGVKDQ